MFESNPAGLDKTDIECGVGNLFNRLLRQQQNTNALSTLKGTTTADHSKGKNRRPRTKFEGNCFNYGKKGHRVGECTSVKRSEKYGDAAADKKDGGKRKCYICGIEENLAHKHCDLCKNLEHRTRECEEQGAKKGSMLARLNMPANSEVGSMMTAKMGAACEDRKEEWESDSGAIFHMFHTRV